MSLFGSSPPEEPSQSTRSGKSQSLFDDDRATGAANSSLFDDGDGTGPSPWDMPTPKKSAKGDMVKTLLPATSVPESYVDAFDLVLEAGFEAGPGSVTLAGAKKLFESSGLDADEQARIVNLITGGQEPSGGLGRSEFNVLVALIGLAQEREELTLDGVDERRRSTFLQVMTVQFWNRGSQDTRFAGTLPTSYTTDENSQGVREHGEFFSIVTRHPGGP